MEEQEIHLRDYLKVVLKRRYMVVTFFIVVFVTTVIGTFSARPAYQATTKVLIVFTALMIRNLRKHKISL
jgi:uncharacterized protein involved in exopolysaccharide biosynthesis